MPIHPRGRMITDSRPPGPCEPVRLEGNARDKQRARHLSRTGNAVSGLSAVLP
jgi:hypothetical protein